jgi:hypothetical protein
MTADQKTEKLGREADRAVWRHEVAEAIRDVVVGAIDDGSSLEAVRRQLDAMVVF